MPASSPDSSPASLAQTRRWQTWLNAYLPPILWALVIFIFSAQPNLPKLEFSGFDFLFKKGAHMGVYAVLYFLLYRGVYLTSKATVRPKTWLITWLLCLFYALTDEFHQSFVSNRQPSIYDVGYDMLGSTSVFLWMHRYI